MDINGKKNRYGIEMKDWGQSSLSSTAKNLFFQKFGLRHVQCMLLWWLLHADSLKGLINFERLPEVYPSSLEADVGAKFVFFIIKGRNKE